MIRKTQQLYFSVKINKNERSEPPILKNYIYPGTQNGISTNFRAMLIDITRSLVIRSLKDTVREYLDSIGILTFDDHILGDDCYIIFQST